MPNRAAVALAGPVASRPVGAGLLWFGWFGFTAGSASGASTVAVTSFVNGTMAAATAVVGWLLVEQFRDGKPTTLGPASGAVAGLVGITPGCGYVEPLGAAAIGLVAGVAWSLAIGLKYRLRLDDSGGRAGRARHRRAGRNTAHRVVRHQGGRWRGRG